MFKVGHIDGDVVIYIAYICVCISIYTHTLRRIYVYNMYIDR